MASGDGGTRHYWPIEEGANLWNGNLHFLLGPTTCVTCGSGSTVMCSFEHELDAAGNRLSVTDKDGKYTAYGMDPTQQLKSDTKWSAKTPGTRSWQRAYKYDPNGNRLAEWHNGVVTNYTIGDNNEITQSVKGSTTLNFSTDHFGNLYNISTPAPVLVAGLTYDNESHLIEITDTAHDDSHTFDGDGRRMSSILNGAANDTFFIHDELTGNVIGEYTLVSGTYTLQSVNTWGIGLIATNRGGTKRYFHFDGLGSTAALTDASEVVQDTYTFSAFGIQESFTGSSTNPFRFCGQWGYYDDGAMGSFYKMLLLGVRYYWPEYGRFLTWDPIPATNLYCYVLNRCTEYIDPMGRRESAPLSESCGGGGSSAGTALSFMPEFQDKLDDPFTKAMCRAACFKFADDNKDGRIGPVEKKYYDACLAACSRLGAKGTKRMWCKGIEALIGHLNRHPAEGYKNIKNKQLIEALLGLWNAMGCPGDIPEGGLC